MTDLFGQAESDAVFSVGGLYRYELTRRWGPAPAALWLMLNPSTADATVNDPTVRRCIGFSKAWGAGGCTVTNLFAWRSTDPKVLPRLADPVGPDNDEAILRNALACTPVVAAWGVHGVLGGRDQHVIRMLLDAGVDLRCLGRTKDGHPRHPLYVAKSQPLEPLT